MAADEKHKPVSKEAFEMLKHDIKNQLSNIQLALEGLRYEVKDVEGDLQLYMASMAQSAVKIDMLLDGFK